MSAQTLIKRRTAASVLAAKGGDKLVALTAYHALSASLADPHCDILLVDMPFGSYEQSKEQAFAPQRG